ncbi:hypothetical protein EPO33_00560 [Patescibacteria group bacterium]|nr:MAG: hypothetical protein EPO33_00560 [Patescibacteria group bacterium]
MSLLALTAFGLFFVNRARAAAPTGTLTGTAQSIVVGAATSTINTLTFTDVSPSEVTATNDLRIRIPAAVNAVWNPFDTTATIGGTASTSTSATVSYESNNKVLVINATERFSPLATLTIADLGIIGVNYETAAAALEFSIDGGAAYGTANVNTAITVTPATLTSTNVEPASLVAGRMTTSTITFTQTTSTPANGIIQVTFPSNFILTSVAVLDGTCTSMDGTFATAVVGQVVSITRSGGTTEPNGVQTCAIGRVINPGTGAAGTYAIETQASGGATQTIEQDAAVTADTFTAGSLTPANVEPVSLTRGVIGTVNVSLTTQSAIPVDGKIVVTFPTGFDVSQASGGTCSSMDGSFATAVSGQVVTITRSAGSVQNAAAESCTIANIKNPTTSGSGGTYQIKTTTTGNATIEENTAVAADTFSAPAGAGGGDTTPPGPVTNVSATLGTDGHSAVLAWTNPADADLAGVRVLRAAVSQALGTTLTETLAGTYTDLGLTAGATYYYTFHPVDAAGNVRTDATEYPFVVTASTSTPPATPPGTPPSAPPASPAAPTLPAGVAAGDLVRGTTAAVYAVSSDGKRHAFPNETVYRTWFPDFSGVKTVSDATLAALPLGKNVIMRPGTHPVKIVSDPKVYAIEPGGVLRWIPSEGIAQDLYGSSWAARVRDVDATLFADYASGEPLILGEIPTGTVVADGIGGYWWISTDASGKVRRHASANVLALNRFSSTFVIASRTGLPASGVDIVGFESGLALPYP